MIVDRLLLVALLLGSVASLGGCGGRTNLDLTGTGGGSGGGSGGGGGGESGDDAGPSSDADTVFADGGQSFDGATDASSTFDASFGDTGVADSGTPLTCGTSSCDPSTQECCIPIMMGATASCATIGQCGGVALSCTGSDNCAAGDVCCLSGLGGGLPTSSCQPSCGRGGGGGGGTGFQLCSSSSDCPPGEQCVATPFGVSVCMGGRGGGGGGGSSSSGG
jgi:hypothetical protein